MTKRTTAKATDIIATKKKAFSLGDIVPIERAPNDIGLDFYYYWKQESVKYNSRLSLIFMLRVDSVDKARLQLDDRVNINMDPETNTITIEASPTGAFKLKTPGKKGKRFVFGMYRKSTELLRPYFPGEISDRKELTIIDTKPGVIIARVPES